MRRTDRCVLPHEVAKDVEAYSAPGPVVTGHMSPEEIAAKYGAPAKREAKELTVPRLHWAVRKFGGWEAAARWLHVDIPALSGALANHNIAAPDKWGVLEDGRCAVEASTAPQRDRLAVGPPEHVAPPESPGNEPGDVGVIWAKRSRLKESPKLIMNVTGKGVLLNKPFSQEFADGMDLKIKHVKVGVYRGRAIVAASNGEGDCYAISPTKADSARFGSSGVSRFLRTEGFIGHVVMRWNSEMSWYESVETRA